MLAVTKKKQEKAQSSTKPTQKVWRKGDLCLLTGPAAEGQLGVLAAEVHQEGRDDVLDACACVGPRDAHQGLQVMGAKATSTGAAGMWWGTPRGPPPRVRASR